MDCNLDANALGELAFKAFYDADDEGERNMAAGQAEYAALCSVYTDGFETSMKRLLTAMLDYRRTRGPAGSGRRSSAGVGDRRRRADAVLESGPAR